VSINCFHWGQFRDLIAAAFGRRAKPLPIRSAFRSACWQCSSWSRIIGAVSGELLRDLVKSALAGKGDWLPPHRDRSLNVIVP
jgi:hypothetical protein